MWQRKGRQQPSCQEMSLSRLLLPRPPFHFHTTGFPKSIRCYAPSPSSSSSSYSSSNLKGAEAGKESGTLVADSHTNEHRQMPSEVQNKVGESWFYLKGIYTNIRKKFLGSTQTSSHFSEIGESQSSLKSSDVPTVPHCSKESISKGTPCNLPTQNSSERVVDLTASEARKMHESTDTIGKHPVHIPEVVNTLHLSEATTSHSVAENFEDVVHTTASEAIKAEQFPEKIDFSWVAVLTAKTETIVNSSEAINASHTCKRGSSTGAPSVIVTKSEDNSNNSSAETLENRLKLLKEAVSGELVGCDCNQKKEGGQLCNFMHGLLNEAQGTAQNKSMNDLASLGNEKHQLTKKSSAFVLTLNGASKLDGMPSSSDAQEVEELAHSLGCTVRKQTSGETAGRTGDHLTPGEIFGNSDGVSPENVGRTSEINVLIDRLMKLPVEQSNSKTRPAIMSVVADQVRNQGSVDKIHSQNNLQNFEAERLRKLLKGRIQVKQINNINGIMEDKDERTPSITRGEVILENYESESNKVKISASDGDGTELAPSPQVASPTIKEDRNQIPAACSEETTENKVLLRFLWKRVAERDIHSAFEDCGPILKIEEIPSPKESKFKDAFAYFKTKSGLQRAQNKTDVLVRNKNIIVEGTSPNEMAKNISIPSLIGDPDVPVSLVKNPTHVVKIKRLTHDISSHQLKEALTFCGSGITSFFLGSSSSVGYVEFETEDAKEMALTKHSIRVSGRQLPVFRVDAPRTTVVRILNVDPNCQKTVLSICRKHGKVNKIMGRPATSIVDVHFKLDEWPNMLNILNSLNGLEVNGKRWIAQPAPVFPPAILEVLWSHPDERRYVKAVIHSMLRKIRQPIAEYTDLAAIYYDHNSTNHP